MFLLYTVYRLHCIIVDSPVHFTTDALAGTRLAFCSILCEILLTPFIHSFQVLDSDRRALMDSDDSISSDDDSDYGSSTVRTGRRRFVTAPKKWCVYMCIRAIICIGGGGGKALGIFLGKNFPKKKGKKKKNF